MWDIEPYAFHEHNKNLSCKFPLNISNKLNVPYYYFAMIVKARQ